MSEDNADSLVVCLVADEDVLDRCPIALRYLQIGLMDEPIETILVLPRCARAEPLSGGPTTIVSYGSPKWPLARRVTSEVVSEVQRRIEALRRDVSVIVHALSGSVAPLADRIATAVGADLIIGVASASEIEEPELTPCAERAAALLVPSRELQRRVESIAPAQKPVEVAQLGATASNTPAAFSAPQLAPALVYAGALTVDCAVDSLLRAVKRVLQHHPTLLVFVIGKGPAEGRLRQLVTVLDLEQTVTLTGRLDHCKHALEAADIYCLPGARAVYREEPIHAMAAGLAIVVPDGTPYDGLIDHQNALIFEEGNEIQMAEQICHLLDHPDFARSIAATAQAYARANHTVAHMVADHVRIYRELESRGSTFSLRTGR